MLPSVQPSNTATSSTTATINEAAVVGRALTRDEYDVLRRRIDQLRLYDLAKIMKSLNYSGAGKKAHVQAAMHHLVADAFNKNDRREFRLFQYHIFLECFGSDKADELMASFGVNVADLLLARAQLPSYRQRPRIAVPLNPVVSSLPTIAAVIPTVSQSIERIRQQHPTSAQRFQPYNIASAHRPATAYPTSGILYNIPTSDEAAWVSFVPQKIKLPVSPLYRRVELACQPRVLAPYKQNRVDIQFQLKSIRLALLNSTKAWLSMQEERDVTEVDGNEAFYSLMAFVVSRYDFDRMKGDRPTPIAYPFECKYSVNHGAYEHVPCSRINNQRVHIPIDLTPHLLSHGQIRPDMNFSMTFNVCPNEYWILIYLVHRIPPASLCKTLRLSQKSHSLKEATKKKFFLDQDVAVERTILTLKCPLLFTPIEYPARGLECSHFQTFDLFNYFLYNAQNSTYVCPVCNKFLLNVHATAEFLDVINENGMLKLKLVDQDYAVGIRLCDFTREIVEEYDKIPDKDDHFCVIDQDGNFKFEKEDKADLLSDEDEDGILVNNKMHKPRYSSTEGVISLVDLSDEPQPDGGVIDLTLD